jgi:hypothetical protein
VQLKNTLNEHSIFLRVFKACANQLACHNMMFTIIFQYLLLNQLKLFLYFVISLTIKSQLVSKLVDGKEPFVTIQYRVTKVEK